MQLRHCSVALFSLLACCGNATLQSPSPSDTAVQSSTPDRLAAVPVSGATFEIANVNSSLVLDVLNASGADGAQVQQWDYWQGKNQQWQLTSAANGAFFIVNVNSGKCLDVSGGSKRAGAKVQQWDCWGGVNQQWQLRQATSATYTIVSVNSGLCLDVWGSSTRNGGVVSQYGCRGGANQAWTLTQLSGSAVNPNNYANPLDMTLGNEPALADGAAPYGYQYTPPAAGASLFNPSGVTAADDVDQGYLGDCYFMAALSVVADRFPQYVHDGIVYTGSNSDGSHNYLVRLFAEIPAESQNFEEQWVPTSDRLYTQPNGTLMGAQGTVLWPAIFEKAFAKLANVTHQVGATSAAGYETINEGGNFEGFEALTGIAALTSFDRNAPYPQAHPTPMDLTQVLAGVNSGAILTSTGFINSDQLAQTAGYNSSTQQVVLPSGATVTTQNDSELQYDSTNQPGGSRVALISGHVFGVLASDGTFAYIRNPWGSNPDDLNNADGAFWIPIEDLQILSTLSYVTETNGSLEQVATPHTH